MLALAAGLAIAWSVAQRLGAPFLPVFAAGAMGYAAIAFGAGLFRSGSSRRKEPSMSAAPMLAAPGANLTEERDPFVTVLLAVRNEERHICAALDAVRAQDWPRDRMEILVADGCSTDATRSLVERVAARDPRVRLIDNPDRFVAQGLNRALAASRGDVIVRVDGHCRVPSGYVRAGVEALRSDTLACAGSRSARWARRSSRARHCPGDEHAVRRGRRQLPLVA